MGRYLKVSEVMERLNLSKGKTYQCIKDGTIPSVTIGGAIRIPEEELERMLRSQLEGNQSRDDEVNANAEWWQVPGRKEDS